MSSQILPQRILVVGGVLLATLVLAVYAYSSHNQFLLVGLPAFPVLVFLLSKTRFTFALAIALSASALTLPGLPGKLNLYLLVAGVTSVALTANAIINKPSGPSRPSNIWVLALAALIVITASVRGFGLRALGGESWGGFSYISMLLACFFFLASSRMQLPEKIWRRTIVWMCLLSLLPTLAQAVYAYSGGALHHMFYFIVPEYQVLEFMQQREQGSQLARLQQANVTSQYFFMLGLLLLHNRKNLRWAMLFFISAVILAGISGNRIAVIFNVFFTLVFLLTNRRLTLPQILFHPGMIAGGFAVFVLSLFASHLPMTFQRILSLIPFANISWEAKLAASSTISWRLEVWEAALRQVPDYLLIGKGFAFSAQDIMTISARTMYMNDIDYVLASRNYHNGMLHTLLDLGLPGLLISLGFIVSVAVRHWGLLNRTWHRPTLKHFHHVFYAVFITTVLTYFVLAGGVTHLNLLFFWTIILEGMVRADAYELEKTRPRTDPVPAHFSPRRFRDV